VVINQENHAGTYLDTLRLSPHWRRPLPAQEASGMELEESGESAQVAPRPTISKMSKRRSMKSGLAL
jgi:hypothetical protein